MRNALIPYYAKDPRARKYLFEEVVNINAIATSWKFIIFNYLQKASSEKDKFYAKTLLCISDLLRLNLNWVTRFNEEFPNQTPHHDVSPYLKGLWFSCKTICLYFSNASNIKETIVQAELYSKDQQSTWNENDLNNFDYGLIVGLLVAKQYDVIYKLLKRFATPKPKENLVALEKALILTYEYSKWLKESNFDAEKMQDYEGFLNEMPQWNSYIPIIMGKNWLAMYYLSLGKADKAYELFRKSIEISNLAGYLVFEVRILKKLYSVLLSLGEMKKASECESFAKGLVEKKGEIFDLL
jgi:tetratricopeptide (TPR) repeat protein